MSSSPSRPTSSNGSVSISTPRWSTPSSSAGSARGSSSSSDAPSRAGDRQRGAARRAASSWRRPGRTGKTTASLGLIAGFTLAGHRLGFLKPVGQRYLVVDGTRADEDAVLIREVFDLPDALNDMSPVTLPRHFTTDYILGRIDEDLGAQVKRAFDRVAVGKDLVVIEGTGHAGVGAVVGLSNAAAAALLETKVIIVSEGGIGRPIDEIVLNASLFDRHGVEVIGAIVNKVDVAAHPETAEDPARRAWPSTGSISSAAFHSTTCSRTRPSS